MNLYFVANNCHHVFHAAVALWSIVSCDDSSTRYNVFLKTELEEKTWRDFFLTIPRVSVYGVPFNIPYEQSVLLKKMKDLDGNDSRKYFYHKFDLSWTESISHLLTDDRLLLLDTDLYARKPLQALYETPLADHECMAMVIDTGIWKYPEWVLDHNRFPWNRSPVLLQHRRSPHPYKFIRKTPNLGKKPGNLPLPHHAAPARPGYPQQADFQQRDQGYQKTLL